MKQIDFTNEMHYILGKYANEKYQSRDLSKHLRDRIRHHQIMEQWAVELADLIQKEAEK